MQESPVREILIRTLDTGRLMGDPSWLSHDHAKGKTWNLAADHGLNRY